VDRRLAGVLVLVISLTAALIAGAARPKVLPGSPAPQTLVGAPAIGDCLTEPIPTASQAGPFFPELAPCTGSRTGEVVGVFAAIPPAGALVEHPYSDVCTTAENRYLGKSLGPDGNPDLSPDRWYPMIRPASAVVTSADPDRPWIACVIGLPQSSPAGTYELSLRDSLSRGPLPPEFATCTGTTPTSFGDCGKPHRGEIIGNTAALASPPTRSELQASCERLATTLTGIRTPTAPPLRVVVSVTMAGFDGSGRETVSLQCRIEALDGHVLTGPLAGLGSRPIPVG
jgi:hypothetical protein